MRRWLRAFLISRTEGIAAVEFALVAPIFMLIFIPMVDLGLYLSAAFQLNRAVSSATNYAMTNTSNVSSTNGSKLAQNMAAVIANDIATLSPSATVTVVVNNGPTARATGTTVATTGTASNADKCYCPTLSGDSVTWGTAQTCAASCSGGGIAGKFVTISANIPFSSLFDSGGVIMPTAVTTHTVIGTN